MSRVNEMDLLKLKELLQRAGEFIAYFELAETKFLTWQEEIEQRTKSHQTQFQEELNNLQEELRTLREQLSDAGLSRIKIMTEEVIKVSQKHSVQIQENEKNLHELSETILKKVDAKAIEAVEKVDTLLHQYDVQQFNRIANESCHHVEEAAKAAISKSQNALQVFQWKTVGLVFITTLITIFFMGLYVNDEYPWEEHRRALSERDAGKMLMSAWPELNANEKTKILRHENLNTA